MSKLNFSIALKMVTDQFQKGAAQVNQLLKRMQYHAIGMASAFGLGAVGLKGLVSSFIETARETERANVALKNVSASSADLIKNQKFLINLSREYGANLNDITGEFAKFTAASNAAGISLEEQYKVYTSVTRATKAFGLSADETKRSFVAITQMMGKGKVSSEELRLQLGEKIPIAIEAMARAVGGSVADLEVMMKKGAVSSAEYMGKFADELNKMIPNVDVDNIESSLSKLKNTFTDLTKSLKIGDMYKKIVDGANKALASIQVSFERIGVSIVGAFAGSKIFNSLKSLEASTRATNEKLVNDTAKAEQQKELARAKRVAAEKRYNEMSALYSKASNSEQLAYYSKMKSAESQMDKARLREKAAIEKAERMAVMKSTTFWGNAWKNIKGTVISAVSSIKAAMLSIIPMAVSAALTNFVMKLIEARKEAKRINDVFASYKRETTFVGAGEEAVRIRSLLKVLQDQKSTKDEINTAQSSLLKMLDIEKGTQEEIIRAGEKKISILRETARAQLAATKAAQAEEKQGELARKAGLSMEQMDELTGSMGKPSYYSDIGKAVRESGVMGKYNATLISNAVKEYAQNAKIIADAEKTLAKAVIKSSDNNTKTTFDNTLPGSPVDSENKSSIQKVEQRYIDELTKINNLHDAGVTSQEEKNKAIDELNNAIYREIGALEGSNAKLNDIFQKAKKGVENPLYSKKIEPVTLPTEGIRDTTFDYKKDNIQQLEELRQLKAEYISSLKGISEEQFSGISQMVDAEAQKLKNMDDLIKAGKVKKDIEEISKEIKDGTFRNIEQVYSLAKNLGSAFTNIVDTLSNADASFFEKLVSIFDAIFSTMNGIKQTIEMMEKMKQLTEGLTQAKESDNRVTTDGIAEQISNIGSLSTVVQSASIANTTAQNAENASTATGVVLNSTKQAAKLPFPANIAAIAGTISAVVGLLGSIKGFAGNFTSGGIVGGSSYTGDKLLGGLNSGEMILNKGQQSNLWKVAQGGGLGSTSSGEVQSNQSVQFKVSGTDLIGVLNNHNKKVSRR